ncbi:MAG: DinB family protein [Thermoanaerobaculia bacterium]
MAESTPTAAEKATTRGPKKQFLEALEREHQRTMRVLRAYPEDKANLRPHERSGTARELAWIFVLGQNLMTKALTTGFDWSNPSGGPPAAPATMKEIVDAAEEAHRRLVETLQGMDESRLDETVQFFVGPKTLGEYTKLGFLEMILFDHVHHRGQLSVYLRMAGAKVPSIYGPSADEPWR